MLTFGGSALELCQSIANPTNNDNNNFVLVSIFQLAYNWVTNRRHYPLNYTTLYNHTMHTDTVVTFDRKNVFQCKV